MLVVADVLSRRKCTRQIGFDYVPRIAFRCAKNNLDAILLEQADRPRPHTTCYYRRHSLFGNPSGKKSRLMTW